MRLALGAILFVAPAVAQDLDAFERRLGSAVAEGEITLAQAHRMMQALRQTLAGPAAPLAVARQPVAAPSKEQVQAAPTPVAPTTRDGPPTGPKRADPTTVPVDGTGAALVRAGVPSEHVNSALDAHRRILVEVHVEGRDFELDESVRTELVGLGLDDAQVERVVALARQTWNDTVREAGGVSQAEYERYRKGFDGQLRAGRITASEHERVLASLEKAREIGDRVVFGAGGGPAAGWRAARPPR